MGVSDGLVLNWHFQSLFLLNPQYPRLTPRLPPHSSTFSLPFMEILTWPLLICYLGVMSVLCIYGGHRYWMVWQYYRRAHGRDSAPAERFVDLPRVTVQLPMFNEMQVAERVIRAACAIDYPRELLQIQVLDDSTDESAQIARSCCEAMAAEGHDIEYLHRENREGFKAGALAAGMASATGKFVAIFDADFVPPPDIIHHTIHHFTDERVGMVQTRWEHLNREESLLTRIQAMFLDGHFVVEQAARSAMGCWFNFNGTAGVWRRQCIEDAGGWQHDTLTEDTDLSYRAQMAGWRFEFLSDVTCPAELPPTVSAFLGQQHRWTKGLMQTGIKLLPRILRSEVPLRVKVEAWFHLTSPLPYAAILLLSMLALPALFIPLPQYGFSGRAILLIGLICLGLGTCAAGSFYLVSQWVRERKIIRILLMLPALMAVGVGMSIANTRAIVEAMLGKQSPFIRTPKFNGAKVSAMDPALESRPRRKVGFLPRFIPGMWEVGLGLGLFVCIAGTMLQPATLVGTPFLVLFAAGFLAIGVPRLREGRG